VRVWTGDAVLENPPLRTTKPKTAELFVLNWVNGILLSDEMSTEIEWFYNTIRKFRIPAGAESKFANTEAFFLRHYEIIAKNREAAKKGKSRENRK
jgi:hypothetical protein